MADEMSIASLIISIIILIVVIILIFIVCYYYNTNTNNNGNKNRFLGKIGNCNEVNYGCICTIKSPAGAKTNSGVCIGNVDNNIITCDTQFHTQTDNASCFG